MFRIAVFFAIMSLFWGAVAFWPPHHTTDEEGKVIWGYSRLGMVLCLISILMLILTLILWVVKAPIEPFPPISYLSPLSRGLNGLLSFL